MNYRFLFLVILVISFSKIGKAQTIDNSRKYLLSATLFNEHIAAPFDERKGSPTHLGVTVAFEMSRKRNSIYQFTHIFQAGYFYHKSFTQVAFIAWKPKFELRFSQVFNVHGIVGLGYAHSFLVQQSYKLENGIYKERKNGGKPHAIPSIGFGAGFHLDKLIAIPVELFGRYETFSLAPYALKSSTPVTLNTMLSFGIKYSL